MRNVNAPDLSLSGGSDKAPAVYALGIARWTGASSISMEGTSWKSGLGQDYRLSLGGERWFRNGIGVRTGYGLGSRGYQNVAVGASYRMDGFQFDYGLNYPLQGVETAGTHMVSLAFRFGKPAPDPVESDLAREREARMRAEAEMVRLRQQLAELTSKPMEAPSAEGVDRAVGDALHEAEEEIKRLRESEPAAPVQELPAAPAVSIPVAPEKAVAPKPAAVLPRPPAPKPRAAVRPAVSQDLLSQYSDALKFYADQVKSNAPAEERVATLKRILEKYQSQGIDTSAIQSELKKLEGASQKVNEDYAMAVSYYRRIVQQGTSADERIILLERIIKKYQPLGADTSELERELKTLEKK
jgi:hypothetical protein